MGSEDRLQVWPPNGTDLCGNAGCVVCLRVLKTTLRGVRLSKGTYLCTDCVADAHFKLSAFREASCTPS